MLGKCATHQFIYINQFFVLPTNPALFLSVKDPMPSPHVGISNETSERSETLSDAQQTIKVSWILQGYCRKHDLSFGGHGRHTPDVQEGQEGQPGTEPREHRPGLGYLFTGFGVFW